MKRRLVALALCLVLCVGTTSFAQWSRLKQADQQQARLHTLARQANRVVMAEATWNGTYELTTRERRKALVWLDDFDRHRRPQKVERGWFTLHFYRGKRLLGTVQVEPLCTGPDGYVSSGCDGKITGALVNGYYLKGGSGRALIDILDKVNLDV